MHRDTTALKSFLDSSRGFFADTHALLTDLSANVKSRSTYSLEDLVDLGFLCREISRLVDDLRKECNARQELIGKVIALEVTQESVAGTRTDPTVRGTLATGTPDVKPIASVPRPGTPAYASMCAHFGLDGEAVENQMFEFRFKRIGDWLLRLAEEGRDPPKGFLQTYQKFSTVFRKKSPK